MGTTETPANDPAGLPRRERVALLAAVTLLVALDGINATATGIPGADIRGELHATPDQFAWVGMLYLIGKLCGFIVGPWLATRFPIRRLLLAQGVLLTLGAAGAALATHLPTMWAMRLLHGLAGGLVLAIGQATVAMVLPRAQQPFYQALLSFGSVIVPSALAPQAHGWLTEHLDWRLIGWLSLPVAATGLALGWRFLPRRVPGEQRGRPGFDWGGTLLLVATVAPLTYLLVEGNRYNWFYDPHIAAVALLVPPALAAFVAWELRREPERALVDLRIIGRHPHFLFAWVVALMAGFVLFGGGTMIQSVIVRAMDYPPDNAGALIALTTFTLTASFAVACYLIQVRGFDPMKLPVLGLSIMIGAMLWLSGLASPVEESHVAIGILLRGSAMGLLFLSLTMDWVWGVPRSALPSASGLFNFNRQLGGMVGVAVLGTFMSHHGEQVRQTLAAHLDAGAAPYRAHIAQIRDTLLARGVPPEQAQALAPRLVADTLGQQTLVTTFSEVFLVVIAAIACAAPFVLALFLGVKARERREHAHREDPITQA